MSIKVINFGCRLNIHESEIIKQEAKKAGLENQNKEIAIFNTCAVTAEAVRQARQSIRKAYRENPNISIIVTGCAAQTTPEKFTNMEEVQLVLGNEEKKEARFYQLRDSFGVDSYEKARVNDIMSVKETAAHMIDSIDGYVRGFIQIQNGCNHRCTFCIIPFARGNSRSVPIGAITEQMKHITNNGYKEIVLTGVDITAYGADLPGAPSLGFLVKTILKEVPNIERLRLSSIDCIEADEDLLEVIATEKRFMPHLHLSLQAGDNLILKRMKRRHLREDAIRFCEHIKKLRPNMIFGADIIVGFPTESEEMFQNTINIVRECNLTHLHVFPFSSREKTPASRMPQLDKKIIKNRAAHLREIAQEIYTKHLTKQKNTTQSILIEKENIGRTEDFTLCRVNEIKPAGSIISVYINSQQGKYLTGEIIS